MVWKNRIGLNLFDESLQKDAVDEVELKPGQAIESEEKLLTREAAAELVEQDMVSPVMKLDDDSTLTKPAEWPPSEVYRTEESDRSGLFDDEIVSKDVLETEPVETIPGKTVDSEDKAIF